MLIFLDVQRFCYIKLFSFVLYSLYFPIYVLELGEGYIFIRLTFTELLLLMKMLLH